MDSNVSLKDLTEEIMALSCKMASAAENGQWDDVVEFESQRNPHLLLLEERLGSLDKASEMDDSLRETATFVIDSDGEIVRLAELHKAYLLQESSDIDTSRKAVNAYLDNISP